MNNELIKRILSSLVLISITFFAFIKGSIFFNLFVLLALLITLYEWHRLSLKKVYYLPGFIFIFFSLYTFYYFRVEGEYKFFLLILLTCISTDIGGYLFGKIFKGPKLTKISPNKTYAGMFGSFILSLILATLYFDYVGIKFSAQLITIILLISFVSQAGDLIISFFKRKSKIKHTGKILPGHGGLLDRIDGMVFAFPFMYILLKII
tara:strand:- start:235 stop:855 length:621 start_codon:yes stop_codon:yes gene_type:complete